MMRIRFFASLSEVTGAEEIQLQGITTTGALREKMLALYPALSDFSFAVAVNHRVVHDDQFPLMDEDEVALLPPFSGG